MMKLTRKLGVPVVAGGIALAGLFGPGLAGAAADPGRPCGVPNTPACQQQNNDWQHNNGAPQNNDWQHNNGAPQGNDWQQHNFDQARQDHRPFDFNGQHVQPMRAGNGDGWGFWLFGQWIRL